MPRIRTVKPKFFDDAKLGKVSRDARLLFIGMWNFADDCGVILADPVWIKSKVFPYDKLEVNQLENWLKELESFNFIILISNNNENFYFIRTFNKHQRINKPNGDDIYIPIDCLSIILNELNINHGTITEQSRSNPTPSAGGEEGKGKERNSRGGEGIYPKQNFEIELSEVEIGKAIEYVSITKNVMCDDKTVKSFWETFKIKNFTGEKFYKNERGIISHFFESLKFQQINGAHKQHSANGSGKQGTSDARIDKARNW
jgi:hypothetical protein